MIPTRQADAVALRVIGGLSVEETATVLGVTVENVRVLSHRGLNAIQAILTTHDDSPPAEPGEPDDALDELALGPSAAAGTTPELSGAGRRKSRGAL
ncbi:MAG: sigma factor-like helix-turn-helix DNA-binding protein [Acidimicrobiales bacterium]